MYAGRKTYDARKGALSTAFSAMPFTRAHMLGPRSELSDPAPDTKTKVMSGLTFASVLVAATVISSVTERYASSVSPSDETPRQKKHASLSVSSRSTDEKS